MAAGRTGRHGVEDFEHALDGLAGLLYVHLDLDVLEPTAFGSVCFPEPAGVLPERLVGLVSRLDGVVGLAL